MPGIPTFDPQGGGAAQSLGLFGDSFSLMQRAQLAQRAQANQDLLTGIEADKFELEKPALMAKTQADVAGYGASLANSTTMQQLRQKAAIASVQAAKDYADASQIPDYAQRADALDQIRANYGWMAVADPQYQPFVDQVGHQAVQSNADANLRLTLKNNLQARTMMYAGMTADEIAQAQRIRAGIDPRAGSAAPSYRNVVGSDGVTRLMLVNPLTGDITPAGFGAANGPASAMGIPPSPTGIHAPTSTSTPAIQEQPNASVAAPSTPSVNLFSSPSPAQKIATTEQAKYQAELAIEKPKREAALQMADATTQRITDNIDQLINQVSSATTGLGGVVMDHFPGTSARDFQANLDAIKSALAIQGLQAMKAASPNGSTGLGKVTNSEMNMLSNQLGSLEIGQSPMQAIQNLKKIRQGLIETQQHLHGAFAAEYGVQPTPYVAPTAIRSMTDDQLKQRLQQLQGAAPSQ